MKRKTKRTLQRAALCAGAVLVLALFTSFGAARNKPGDTADIGADSPGGAAESSGGAASAVVTAAPGSAGGGASLQGVNRQAELAAAKRANGDAVAWIVMPGAEVDHAVMQGDDNAQYLQLDELGNYAEWGCYYADCRDKLSSRSALVKNTVIYGHSQSDCDPDGERFTKLHRYTDAAFVRDNPYIYLSVDGEDLVFQIAAVFFTDVSFDYINPDPAALGGTTFYDTVAAANYLAGDAAALTPADTLLTLSTCCRQHDAERTGNHRLVVIAKLADGQPADYDITQAPNPVTPWGSGHE